MSKWTVTVEKDDNGELILPFTDEMLKEVGWKINDELVWTDNNDGSWTLSKKEPTLPPGKVWVMVDTISQYRMRYIVEAPANHPEYALDTVTMEEAKEFSQQWLGETIVSHRVVAEEEALQICDKDNDYASEWNSDKKVQVFFTKESEFKRDE